MMKRSANRCAFVFLPSWQLLDEFHPLRCKIFSLTIFERTLKALDVGGITRVVVIGVDEERNIRQQIRESLFANISIEIKQPNTLCENSENQLLESARQCGTIVLTEPIILDVKFCDWIEEQSRAKNDQPISTLGGTAFYFPSSHAGSQLVEFLAKACLTFSSNASLVDSNALIASAEEVPYDLLVGHKVHDAESKEVAKNALIRSLIKPTDGWVSKNLNRPISTSITRLLANTSITPNQFTIFTGLIGVLTGYFLAQGPYWGFMIGALLFHLTSVLDGVDGELARLKFMSSPYGQWLDTVVDNSSYVIALVGYLIGLYSDGFTSFERIAGISAVVFTLLALGSMYYYLRRYDKGGSLLNIDFGYKSGQGTMDKVLRALAPLGKRDLFALIFFIMGLFGILNLALIFIAVLSATMLVISLQAHMAMARTRK